MENKGYPEEIDIQKYLLVLKRRWLIICGVFGICTGLGGLALFLEKPSYEASAKLLFQSNKTSSLTGVGEKIGHLESIKRESNPLDTQALIVRSEENLQEVIDTLKLQDENGNALNTKDIGVDAQPLQGTDVLNISFTSTDPVLAKAVVNQVMKSYIAQNIESNQSEAVAAGAFIQRQLPRVKSELDKAAEALRRFQDRNQIINLEEETTGTVENLTTLDEDLNRTRSSYAELLAKESQIKRQINLPKGITIDIASLSQQAGVQEAIKELQKVQTELANQRSRYRETHPTIIDLKGKKTSLRNLIRQRTNESLGYQARVAPGNLQMGELQQGLLNELVGIQAQRSGLENKIASLSQLKDAYRKRANALPSLRKQQGELERRLSIAQQSYENLLTKLQEIKVAENQTVGNAKILEYAKLESSPKAFKKKVLVAGGSIFVGLLLGLAAAYFVDLIDRRLKTPQEAEKLFGYTLLGLIPKYETNHTLEGSKEAEAISPRVIVVNSPRSVIHEAYQMLQANLKFVSLDRKVRKVVITSSVSGEGKTEVAANLAATIAQTGKRVLLVDADMRQPSQHHIWGLINSTGLSNVMVGQQRLSQGVQEVTESLSVLTSGVIPPNPLALLDSECMTSLIDMLSQNYDYVIFDTPPLAGTADAAVLGKMVDGVLMVARPGVVDSKSAIAAKSLLTRSDAQVLGLVANAVNIKHQRGNYFYSSGKSSYKETPSEGSRDRKPERTLEVQKAEIINTKPLP
ncbi:MAG: polysaccharide biosynthesis tyrosine autokinase [Cyanobacteria bacterium P01_A01_bin.45]|mgnify:CR=1 FL=1